MAKTIKCSLIMYGQPVSNSRKLTGVLGYEENFVDDIIQDGPNGKSVSRYCVEYGTVEEDTDIIRMIQNWDYCGQQSFVLENSWNPYYGYRELDL